MNTFQVTSEGLDEVIDADYFVPDKKGIQFYNNDDPKRPIAFYHYDYVCSVALVPDDDEEEDNT